MQGNTQDFKQAYAGMSDEGLLSVNRDELVEGARQCYDEELARRSLTWAQPEPPMEPAPPAEHSEPPEEMVCVAVFFSPADAGLAQSVLESAEVPCFLPDQHMVDISPFLAVVLGGRRLMTPASYADQARELLAPMIAEANKAIVRHWFEQVWNKGHDDAATAFGAGADVHLRALLPDLNVTVDDLIAEADKVAVRITIQGTHNGTSVQFHGVVFVRLANGRIVDTWDMNDAPVSLMA